MEVPGLDELEESIAEAVDALDELTRENTELRTRLAAVGKEIESLATQIANIELGQKFGSDKKKRIMEKLKSIAERLA